jgi:hypothetical protein
MAHSKAANKPPRRSEIINSSQISSFPRQAELKRIYFEPEKEVKRRKAVGESSQGWLV